MREWISAMNVFRIGNATSFSCCGLSFSGVSGCANTEGKLVTSRPPSANDVGRTILFRGVDAVVQLNVVVDVCMLEGVGKKLKQSS